MRPLAFGNMRDLGVHSLAVTCELCHHEAVLSAERWGDAVLVRALRPACSAPAAGIVGADARRNWREMLASGIWQSGSALLLSSSNGFDCPIGPD